jgi:hypothetical protein
MSNVVRWDDYDAISNPILCACVKVSLDNGWTEINKILYG